MHRVVTAHIHQHHLLVENQQLQGDALCQVDGYAVQPGQSTVQASGRANAMKDSQAVSKNGHLHIHVISAKVMNPYFRKKAMLAKITAKNQLTLPKSLTQAVGATEYFDVEARGGQLILTPVRIQRGDAVRAKLADLALTVDDMAAAVAWARAPGLTVHRVNEPAAAYGATPDKPKKKAAKKNKAKT